MTYKVITFEVLSFTELKENEVDFSKQEQKEDLLKYIQQFYVYYHIGFKKRVENNNLNKFFPYANDNSERRYVLDVNNDNILCFYDDNKTVEITTRYKNLVPVYKKLFESIIDLNSYRFKLVS